MAGHWNEVGKILFQDNHGGIGQLFKGPTYLARALKKYFPDRDEKSIASSISQFCTSNRYGKPISETYKPYIKMAIREIVQNRKGETTTADQIITNLLQASDSKNPMLSRQGLELSLMNEMHSAAVEILNGAQFPPIQIRYLEVDGSDILQLLREDPKIETEKTRGKMLAFGFFDEQLNEIRDNPAVRLAIGYLLTLHP